MTSTNRLLRRTALAMALPFRVPVLLLGLLAMAVILPTVLLLTVNRAPAETVVASAGPGCVAFACDQAAPPSQTPAVRPAAAGAERPAPPSYPFQSAPAASVSMDLGGGAGWHMSF